jgi:hypothetical protein
MNVETGDVVADEFASAEVCPTRGRDHRTRLWDDICRERPAFGKMKAMVDGARILREEYDRPDPACVTAEVELPYKRPSLTRTLAGENEDRL